MSDGSERYQDLFERLEKATTALEQIVSRNSKIQEIVGVSTVPDKSLTQEQQQQDQAKEIEEESSLSIKAFNDFLELYVDPFISYSAETNASIGEIAQYFNNAFKFQLKLIKAASISKKPDFTSSATAELLKPLTTIIGEINQYKEDHFKSDVYFQLSAIGEGSNIFNWFLIEPTPMAYIGDIKDSVTFWTNKVLQSFKEKDPRYVEWVKLFLNIFDGLKLYVKQYHTTGLTWDPNGGDFAKALNSSSTSSTSAAPTPVISPTPAAGGGVPPPPPPPPPPANLFDAEPTSSTTAAGGGINAVFSELNQGENITKGLKKVEKSQMTHKNPNLRESSIVRTASSGSTSSTGKKSPPVPKKPNSLSLKPKPEPVIELNDSKWVIKNVSDKHDIKLDVEISQSLFIADSENITVQLNGKLNAISISGVKKIGLIVDSLISEISVINSKKIGIQVVGSVPQISIDKSDGGEIYLGENSLNTEIYTTCSTSLNIYVPDAKNDGDFKEVNIPEQFKFRLNDKGNLVSEVVEHAG